MSAKKTKRPATKLGSQLSERDLQLSPIWEVDLNNEDSPDFRDGTVRPSLSDRALQEIKRGEFYGHVRAEFVAACGRVFIGDIEPPFVGLSADLWSLSPRLRCQGKVIDLALASKGSPGDKEYTKSTMAELYQRSKLGPDEIFPIIVIPCMEIPRVPRAFLVKGFLRPPTKSGRVVCLR